MFFFRVVKNLYCINQTYNYINLQYDSSIAHIYNDFIDCFLCAGGQRYESLKLPSKFKV